VSRIKVLALIFVFLCPALLSADEIVLKNGDRLTGTIEKSDNKALVIKTEFAGEVTVQWPAVQEINSTQPLHVSLSDGKTVVGTVTTSDGNLAVATPNAGTVTEPIATVTKLVGEAEQAACEKSLHPGLLQGWKAGRMSDLDSPAATARPKISISPSPTARPCTITWACTPTACTRPTMRRARRPPQPQMQCKAEFVTTMI
jgi:small nuclear ribonucleoprotein (snRNP)-like protein